MERWGCRTMTKLIKLTVWPLCTYLSLRGAHVILLPLLSHTAGEHWRCVALLCSTLKRPFTFKRSKTTSVLSIKKCVFSSIKAPAPGMNICLKYICFLLLVSFVNSQINWYVGPYSRLVTRRSWLSVKSVITVAALEFFLIFLFVYIWCPDIQTFIIVLSALTVYINCVTLQNKIVCRLENLGHYETVSTTSAYSVAQNIFEPGSSNFPYLHYYSVRSMQCLYFFIHIQDNESIYCSPVLIKKYTWLVRIKLITAGTPGRLLGIFNHYELKK